MINHGFLQWMQPLSVTKITCMCSSYVINYCQVKVEGDDVLVRADKKSLADSHRAPIPSGSKPDQDPRVFLIVGGGQCNLNT